MTIAAALYTHLTGDVALSALIGTRLYPLTVPQISDGETRQPTVAYSLAGRNDEQGIESYRIVTAWEFACMASTYDTAHQVADALIDRLYHFRGTVGDKRIMMSVLTSANDSFEPEVDAYVITVSFDISYA